jgi:hypothetical protein
MESERDGGLVRLSNGRALAGCVAEIARRWVSWGVSALAVCALAGCNSVREWNPDTDYKEPLDKSPARSEIVEVRSLADGEVEIVIPKVEQYPVLERQEEPVWCWAACAAMLSKLGDEPETQAEIAARVHGFEEAEASKPDGDSPDGDSKADPKVRVEAAIRFEVMCAMLPELSPDPFENVWNGIKGKVEKAPEVLLNPEIDLNTGVVIDVIKNQLVADRRVSIEDLLRGNPILIGLVGEDGMPDMGHVYLLHGAKAKWSRQATKVLADTAETIQGVFDVNETLNYVKSAHDKVLSNHYLVSSVRLIDPWGPEVVEMSFAELDRRLAFAISASYARKQLDSWHGTIGVDLRSR